jgi:glutamyl-tRNA synthetase (EC 6.1.1.17)
MSSVYAANRELIDDTADRLFFVRGEPVEFPVRGGPDAGTPPVHPDHDARGRRTLPVKGGVTIEQADCPAEGERVWLKGYGPVRRTDGAFEYTDDDLSVTNNGVDIVHWVPAETSVSLRLRTIKGDVTGLAEPRVTRVTPEEHRSVRAGWVRTGRQHHAAGRVLRTPMIGSAVVRTGRNSSGSVYLRRTY